MNSMKLYNLVKEFGQDYDVVLFVSGNHLLVCRTDSFTRQTLPVLYHNSKLEEVVGEFHRNGLTVRLVWYSEAGRSSVPDLGEFQKYRELDY